MVPERKKLKKRWYTILLTASKLVSMLARAATKVEGENRWERRVEVFHTSTLVDATRAKNERNPRKKQAQQSKRCYFLIGSPDSKASPIGWLLDQPVFCTVCRTVCLSLKYISVKLLLSLWRKVNLTLYIFVTLDSILIPANLIELEALPEGSYSKV